MGFFRLFKKNPDDGLKTTDGKPIFLGGDGRSGTTLLSVILDSHPQLVFGPELHFNGAKNLGPYVLECLDLLIANDPRAFGKGLKENGYLKLGVQFAKRCHRFGIEFADLRQLVIQTMEAVKSDLISFEDRCVLINAIGNYNLERTGALRWGIKVMREIKSLHKYAAIWPQAQFIHIIRDGRDVAASQMKEHGTWGYGDIERAAIGWVEMIEKTRKNAGTLPLIEIIYEELVGNPEPTLKKLLEFLELPWDDAVLRHTETNHTLFENPYNHASIDSIVKPINKAAVGRYSNDLSPEEIKVFEKNAGRHLAELGYPVG